jgi:hypothetical protein
MKKKSIAVILIFLLLTPVYKAAAQSSSSASQPSTPSNSNSSSSNLPQWVKDMRRWDIITFGSFPFSMFTVAFITDLVRWQDANGMDFSDAGRRYAPWPLKSAGAVEMTTEEYQRTLILAASLSAAVAFTDLIIVLIKRNKERRRIESRPTGSATVNIIPYDPSAEAGEDTGETEETDEDSAPDLE